MFSYFYLILSILLRFWPLKFRVQGVNRGCLSDDQSGLERIGAVEYAVWLPFLGWSSAWAVFQAPGQFPRWRVVRFQWEFDSSRGHWPRGEHRRRNPSLDRYFESNPQSESDPRA
jgi:hypothetical protein